MGQLLMAGNMAARFPTYAWPTALGILGTTIVVEVVPLVLGTGDKAILDWSFFYVTLRFIVLPAASVLHLLVNTVVLFAQRGRPLQRRLLDWTSIAIPVSFLWLSCSNPLPFSALF